MADSVFCCPMRRHFMLGIVAERADEPCPTEAADFMDWDNADHKGRPILKIRFCPFCGQRPGQLRAVEGYIPEGGE